MAFWDKFKKKVKRPVAFKPLECPYGGQVMTHSETSYDDWSLRPCTCVICTNKAKQGSVSLVQSTRYGGLTVIKEN